MLKQGPTRRAADANRQIVIAQIEQVTKGAAGLQRQRAQPHSKGAAHALFRIGQAVHDAGVSQRLATAGGRHVDDESALVRRAFTHCRCGISRLVLPAKALVLRALTQAFVARQAGQMLIKSWQGVGHFAAVRGNAQQVFVERLVELTRPPVGVGVQRITFRHGDAAGVLAAEAGIVVVGQHQTQARDVHDIRIAKPVAFAGLCAHVQQAPGQTRGLLAPEIGGHGQTVRKVPIWRDGFLVVGTRKFVPARVDATQHLVQQGGTETRHFRTQPLGFAVFHAGHDRQTVVRED